ncbi:hypothetical protein HYW31_00030 [Candidatus Berkelbacteria bacterium]|nr:hypothetical protein [Candidatus Berkelbacteria bacterium]
MEGIIPVEITVYEDRTFDFRLKKPPVSYLLKKAVGLEKGAAQALREKVATINKEQIREIALEKMEDLNTQDVGQAEKIVSGTAKSMGIAVE